MTRKINLYLSISFITLMMLLASVSIGNAQCIETLRLARTVYDEGRLHELPSILESCLDKGFNDEEKTEAYRLLILSYIYQDQPELADEAMLSLLKANPRFKIDPDADPNELINLHKTFRTTPIYRIGGKVGGNLTYINTKNTGGVNNLNVSTDGNSGKYAAKLGFHFGLASDIPINSHFTLSPELLIRRNTFEYTSNLFSNADGSVASSSLLIENQNWVNIQAVMQYRLFDSDLNPFVAAGGGVDYLLSDKIIATRELLDEQPIRENTLNLIEARNKLSYYLTTGIGVKKNTKKGVFVAEFRFKYGLNNLSKSEKILDIAPEYIFDYNGHYNEFAINTFEISFGYLIDVYKPKKLTK